MREVAVHPIVLSAALRSGLPTERVRALVLPSSWRILRPGDLLWVQEAVTVDPRTGHGGAVWIRYGGMPRPLPLNWPARKPFPRPGYVSATDMPVEFSRFTLKVRRIHRICLRSVPISLAVECGLTGSWSSWAPWGAPEGFVPYKRVSDALRVMFEAMGGERGLESPPLAIVEFDCRIQNVARVLARELAA